MSDQTVDKLIVTDRIGIGTERPEPETQLHISATNKDGKIYLESGGNLLQIAVNSTIASIGTTGNRPLQLQTNFSQGASSGIYISQDGSVGVGTISPQFSLDVQGTLGIINATQFYKDGVPWKVTGNEIDHNTITATNIQNGAITQDKLDDSISLKISDGSVGEAQLALNAVTADKIKDGVITAAKLSFQIPTGSSQWQGADGGPISYSKGNVGIGTGTASPLSKLHVVGGNIRVDNGEYQSWGPITFHPDVDNSGDDIVMFLNSAGSENMRIDANGNVGIGTKGPQAKLQIVGGAIMPSVGDSETAGIMFPKDPFGGSGDAAWMRYYARTGEACTLEIGISNDADDHIALMPSGGVGIGTNKPEYKLDIVGEIMANKYWTHSSRELKENITDFGIEEALETLAGLNPVKFNYKDDKEKEPTIGFIAEDVPDLLATAERKGICALEIVGVLTKVIKQQQEALSVLIQKVATLEAKA